MSAKQERNNEVNKLKMLKERARVGMFGKQEQIALIESLIRITYQVYERDIQQEANEEVHEQIMKMDWTDFQD